MRKESKNKNRKEDIPVSALALKACSIGALIQRMSNSNSLSDSDKALLEELENEYNALIKILSHYTFPLPS